MAVTAQAFPGGPISPGYPTPIRTIAPRRIANSLRAARVAPFAAAPPIATAGTAPIASYAAPVAAATAPVAAIHAAPVVTKQIDYYVSI